MANCYKTICCENDPIFPNPYEFTFSAGNQSPQAGLFETNFVKTAKYSALSFFPKALLLQFKRIANIYFLVIAILQSIPIISPLDPLVAWLPLVVVIGISMAREGYQDYQRYLSDKQTNYGTETQVFQSGKFVKNNWSEVKIGDIIKTETQEMFPADLILLASSSEGGIAFIETASLDGEKNLKPRNSFPETAKYKNEQLLSKLEGKFEGGQPDTELHRFSAKMILKGENQPTIIEGDKQLLYRGTRLKNTKWIYGLVIYTGRNSKIIMNSKSTAEKMSQVQKKVNYILGFIFIIQFILCFIIAILYGVFKNQNSKAMTFIQWNTQSTPLDSLIIFFGYFVLLNTMIPISLIVSIQVVKMAQKVFISSDKLMYSEYRKKNVDVKSASLNEQLGQIEYVFSDKTGTLTMNIMEFKIAVIGPRMYGDLSVIDGKNPSSKDKTFKDENLKRLLAKSQGNQKLNFELVVKDREQQTTIRLDNMKDLADQYMKALSLAHEVVADTDKKGNKIYQGPSPDQITLVDAAREMQYEFMKSTQSTTTVKIHGQEHTFQLLQVFPFTSDRKRMSVVIRDNGVIKMYMKGADSIVKKRLAHQQKLNLDDELTRFSMIGLRTLLVGMRVISEKQYDTFTHNVAELPASNKEKAFNQLVDKLQTNVYLIGATAVLDRLQDQVPQTIRDLIRANIKVWMLTGDKMQTAQNIAKSCNLIQRTFEVLKYEPPPNSDLQSVMQKLQIQVNKAQQFTQQGVNKALLIEGGDLTAVLKYEQTQQQLANLAKNCEAVVACRLLPSQKAQVVKVVRKYLNKITLSIGDGSNDVPMIKQAHIGVGLFGEEGMGAVQASDYALPQFRMLWRLLLVHGRWNYIRISEMILYFFYKNMLFTLPQFLAAFFCAYSAQTIFDDWFVSFYNLAFTSIPLIIRAVFQQDVNYIYKVENNQKVYEENIGSLKSLIKQESYLPHQYKTNKYFYRLFPKIYFIGQENCIFNFKNYLFWMVQAIVQSIIITIFTFFIIGETSVNETGINSSFWLVSFTIFSSVILVVTFKLSSHTRFWSLLLILAIIITTFGFYLIHMWLTNFGYLTEHTDGTTYVAFTSGQCYFVVLLCVCTVLFVDGIVVFLDFNNGGYASKMRKIFKEQKINNRKYYDVLSVTITDNLTKVDRENH